MLETWESAESQGSAAPVDAGQGRESSGRGAGFTDGNSFSMGAGQADEEGSTRLAMNDQLLLYFYTKVFFPSTQLCKALP